MKTLIASLLAAIALVAQPVFADDISTTIENFRGAGAGEFIDDAYGYAVFPSIGKGGIGIGGAHGKGEVYRGGKLVGKTKMSQITYGLQLGGQVYSQMIFFRDERAFDDFTSGNFEFGAQATAVALTAGAQASTHVLQLTVAVSGASEAVEGVIGNVELHHALAEFVEARGLSVHRHAFRTRGGARGGCAGAALNLDQTQTAGAERVEVISGAELGNVGANHGGGAHD